MGNNKGSTKLTPEQVAEAKRLSEAGMPRGTIARQFGVHSDTIRRVIDPLWASAYREGRYDGDHPIIKREVPAHVIEERNAAINAPRSLTAVAFGDPPPSRSALARHVPPGEPIYRNWGDERISFSLYGTNLYRDKYDDYEPDLKQISVAD